MQTAFSAIPRSGMREAAAMPVATSDTRAGSIPADSNRTLSAAATTPMRTTSASAASTRQPGESSSTKTGVRRLPERKREGATPRRSQALDTHCLLVGPARRAAASQSREFGVGRLVQALQRHSRSRTRLVARGTPSLDICGSHHVRGASIRREDCECVVVPSGTVVRLMSVLFARDSARG